MKESPFIAVLKRELDRMVSRRIYFASCIVLPLFSIFFMATIFGNGQMENLPVGVVDGDNTATSREIIRMTEAVPTFRIIRHYADEAEARADVQRKSIYGYLSIPSGFEAKVMDGKETALTYYYHYALMSVGSEIHGAFQSLLKSISVVPIVTHAVALGINQEEIESFLLPVTTQNHPLFNPDMDYSVYLTQPFFFVFLQVILLLVTTYSIGSEGKFHTSANWLAVADGNIWVAVTAKLLPYSFIFIVMSILANYVFFGAMHIPMDCGFWALNLTSALLVIATQALAVFLFSSSEDRVTIPAGMRRPISPKSFASRTMLPGSETSASTVVYMPFFRSYPVTLSLSPASSRTPSSVGIGLFAAAALAQTATAA